MELESTNLINITNSKNERIMEAFSYEKDIKQLMRFLQKILGLINIFLIILFFTIFVLFRIKNFICMINFNKKKPKDLKYYQDLQNRFCDNILNHINRELENDIILYNVSLNDTQFDIFIYNDYDYYSWQIKLNQSFEGEATLHMLNAIQYYADKNDYLNDDIVIFDIGSNVGWYSTFFGTYKYTVLSFEPLPKNDYVLRKNFCRNNKNYAEPQSTITIINEVLYPIETFCDYYKDIKNSKKNLVLCDKSKEKNLDKDYIKIDTIKTNKLSNFIPLINDKRMTLLRFDLEYEGEMAIESGKELITKYHIPFVFIEFNMLMFALHETRPQDFLRFFTQNGYKISLNGFLNKQFISVEDIMKTNFVTINLYLVYVGE
jgi:hypothetical protein